MRIFLYEHITGGGFADESLPPSLAREGDLMLRALAHDLRDVPGTEVFITRDARLPPLDANISEFPVRSQNDANRIFRHCCSLADAVWPIAPESNGTLEALSAIVLNSKRLLLGSRPDAVRVTGSKAKTAEALGLAGVAVVPTYLNPADMPDAVQQVVIKPDDGAGCLNTRLVDRDIAQQWWLTTKHHNNVAQPYVHGEALSLSLLCDGSSAQLLSCNRQQVSIEEGEFRFAGVSVNAIKANRAQYQSLAEQVNVAIPGLWGYVGIDLVDTEDGPVVVEINPRLTTSYVGLRRALHCNPAALVLALLDPTVEQPAPSDGDTVHVNAFHA